MTGNRLTIGLSKPDESEVGRILRQNDLIGLERLLKSGYDVEKTDEYGRTLIEKAAIENRPEVIQALFDHGAQLQNALEYARENFKFFPEHKASVDLLERLQRERGG
jgi:ankyrin repeat protein